MEKRRRRWRWRSDDYVHRNRFQVSFWVRKSASQPTWNVLGSTLACQDLRRAKSPSKGGKEDAYPEEELKKPWMELDEKDCPNAAWGRGSVMWSCMSDLEVLTKELFHCHCWVDNAEMKRTIDKLTILKWKRTLDEPGDVACTKSACMKKVAFTKRYYVQKGIRRRNRTETCVSYQLHLFIGWWNDVLAIIWTIILAIQHADRLAWNSIANHALAYQSKKE